MPIVESRALNRRLELERLDDELLDVVFVEVRDAAMRVFILLRVLVAILGWSGLHVPTMLMGFELKPGRVTFFFGSYCSTVKMMPRWYCHTVVWNVYLYNGSSSELSGTRASGLG